MSDPNHAIATVIERPAPVERMHPLVELAMRGGQVDPAMLRELLAVQREYEAGEARKAFTAALIRLKAEMPAVIERDKTVDFTAKSTGMRTHYTHASLAAALEAVTPHLTAHGFALAWTPSTDKGQVSVTCRLTHSGGHSEETTITAPVDTSGSKSAAQGTASTITLLQRYTALSLLGIATADMTEPRPAEPQGVDTRANLRAVAGLQKFGKSKAEAEAHVGRPVAEWTAADLDTLRAWVRPERQPGDD